MTTDATAAALAKLGIEPGDLPREVLDTVAAHLEAEPDMGDLIRSERDGIPDRHRAMAARVFGQPAATPTENSPAAFPDLGQGARPVTPEPPNLNDVIRGAREHARQERADRIDEARQDRRRH